MFDIEKINGKIPMTIYTEGTDEIDLLYNWLEKIPLTVLVENYVMSEFKVSIYKNSNFRLEAATTVEPIDLEKHGYKLEVKGITYHAMELTECRDLIKIRYVVDL
jgi:SHS2 domain-containing protein